VNRCGNESQQLANLVGSGRTGTLAQLRQHGASRVFEDLARDAAGVRAEGMWLGAAGDGRLQGKRRYAFGKHWLCYTRSYHWFHWDVHWTLIIDH